MASEQEIKLAEAFIALEGNPYFETVIAAFRNDLDHNVAAMMVANDQNKLWNFQGKCQILTALLKRIRSCRDDLQKAKALK